MDPAAISATDGKWIIAAQDRNGLRPLRYTITSDKLLFAGSETGMIPFLNEKIIFNGRLGPGQAIAIDLDKGTGITTVRKSQKSNFKRL